VRESVTAEESGDTVTNAIERRRRAVEAEWNDLGAVVLIGYGGDSLVSAATGLARETIRNGRRELARGVKLPGRIGQPAAGRPDVEDTQPGVTEAFWVDTGQSPSRGECLARWLASVLTVAPNRRRSSRFSERDDAGPRSPGTREIKMDTTTVIVIVLVVLLAGAGEFFYRRRV
jgi:hypothetical protein